MNLLPRWVWTRSARHRDAQGDPDPGDMGTAFGLDASLAPLAGEADVQPAPRRDTPVPWHQRLDRRPRR